jgi:3-hydroxymyristoyl/3-hydroxydecanoyl-(acyl carrier protein) dehydratase
VINIGGHQLQNVFAQSVPFLPSPCQIEIPQPPVIPSKSDKEESWQKPSVPHEEPNVIQTPDLMKNPYSSQPQMDKKQPEFPPNDMLRTFNITQEETVKAHNQFLDFSIQLQKAMGETLMYQNALLAKGGGEIKVPESSPQPDLIPDTPSVPPAFSREMCMEFAVGSVGRVLGPEFAIVDTYPARVRLPDEPLMLVDRILEVEGEKGSLTSGRVVTEHDVKDGAWYLDGNRAPVCISVEAGQADLFLSGYLGIDLKVKGLRTYRLLDAKVSFHRQLPQPGDTIRYEIHIDKFIRQQDTYLFFFRYEGYIGDSHLITMTDGCAGFFTAKEVEESGGIILTTSETASMPGKRPADWKPLAPMAAEKYSDHQIQALQKGNLSACFGTAFEHKVLAESLHLPAGRMHLIHRVLTLEPDGGRFGLGRIVAEADIHPDDWFLTCHFVDDKVMPGTLMYECCAHALRIFLQRMGWITNKPGVCYGPKLDVPVRLKCRGPVTPTTKHVQYEVIFKEIGYDPEPYAIADALMYADGHRIVFFEDMSLKLTGITRDEIEAVWQQSVYTEPAKAIFTHQHILEFAVGRPSKAFGDRYKIFDQQRKIARLPGPPYCFIDRITKTAPAPWELKPDGWVEAEVDVSAADWYFIADRSGAMPFCVLLEIALQPCGWLAAYAGSALHSESDLKFRNLGGNGIVHRHIPPEDRILTMRSRLTKVAKAADMIVENFDFEVLADGQPVYTGDTYFGFFTKSALENQKGLPQKDHSPSAPLSSMVNLENNGILETSAPFLPQDAQKTETKPSFARMSLPAKALLMVDRITAFAPTGGPKGLGYIRGEKKVNPKEWFFDAHFYQDPVCPGSLGIESFLQLLKFYAKKLWPDLSATHCFEIIPKHTHNWTYRGQIIQTNQLVTIEAVITKIIKTPMPMFFADGWLSVDGLYIYKMENFGLRLVQQG